MIRARNVEIHKNNKRDGRKRGWLNCFFRDKTVQIENPCVQDKLIVSVFYIIFSTTQLLDKYRNRNCKCWCV